MECCLTAADLQHKPAKLPTWRLVWGSGRGSCIPVSLRLHPALQFTVPCAFPFLSFPCPPLIRGCSNSVSLSWGLFTHLGTALLQPLLKPLISVSFLLCGMIFIKGVIRSQGELSVDGQHQKWADENHQYWPEHSCHYQLGNFFWSIS